jgi:hypothetical protein
MAKRASRSDPAPTSRMEREALHGRERGELIVKLRAQPFAILERELLGLEKRWRSLCSSKSEREELRRRIAEDLYFGAIDRQCSWKKVGKALQRLRRVGFGDVERRAFVAGHFVMWASQNPSRLKEAWTLLTEAERRARALPRDSLQRENILRFIARVRAEHGRDGAPGVVGRTGGGQG